MCLLKDYNKKWGKMKSIQKGNMWWIQFTLVEVITELIASTKSKGSLAHNLHMRSNDEGKNFLLEVFNPSSLTKETS